MALGDRHARRLSAEEFSGYFNILDAEADGEPVLRTTENLPPRFFDEMWSVRTEAVRWFENAIVAQQPSTEFDPLEEELFVRGGGDDRTLVVDVPDFRLLSSDILRRLQAELIGNHPLWRVALVGENAATTVMVYGDAVRIGASPVDADMDDALDRLTATNELLREARLGPRRRRLRYLRSELPRAVDAIKEQPFYIVAVLEDADSEDKRPGIYVLSPADDRSEVAVEGPEGPDQVWTGSALGVDAQGRIVAEFGIPAGTPFRLKPWFPPPDYFGPLMVIERPSGKQHRFDLRQGDIIRDEQLKELFPASPSDG